MKAGGWLALGAGAGLGFLAACFVPPDLVGPYQCDSFGQCAEAGYICVEGVCCKADGSAPVCPPVTVNDGGQDGGTDGGGCSIGPTPDCTYAPKLGLCRDGGWSCATGTRTCTQVVFPQPETCDGTDEDCDGVTDNYPCSGPPDFLVPAAESVSGAMIASIDIRFSHDACLLNDTDPNYTRSPGYLDGGNWRGRGSGLTNFVYFQKADGGTWDLSHGENLRLRLSGVVINPVSGPNPFSQYFQPIVYLCGPGSPEGWRRYLAGSIGTISNDAGSFSVNSVIDLASGGSWTLSPGATASLNSIYRVEVLLTLAPTTDGGTPSFDAGITALGFFRP